MICSELCIRYQSKTNQNNFANLPSPSSYLTFFSSSTSILMTSESEFITLGVFQHLGYTFKSFKHSLLNTIVVCAESDSSLNHLSISFATKNTTDQGLPHCLEHLVFLGSQSYPNRSLLDKIATISLSSGTNAHTFIDQTVYTCVTASPEGSLQLLPVYLDHLFNPVFSEANFSSEIYHVKPSGEEAGVVFSEINSDYFSSNSLVFYELLRKMYPDSCYAYNYGGTPTGVASASLCDMQNFHSNFYHPSNCMILSIGNLGSDKLLSSLQSFFNDFPVIPTQSRPFDCLELTSLNLTVDSINHVTFPSDDEECGSIQIGFRTDTITNLSTHLALEVVLDYLSEGCASPFYQKLITTGLASEANFESIDLKESCVLLALDGVPVEELNNLPKILREILETEVKNLDFDRLRRLISRNSAQFYLDYDSDPFSTISDACIIEFLYSPSFFNSSNSLEKRLATCHSILNEMTDNFWVEIFTRYLLSPFVVVIGTPSTEMSSQISKNQSKMIEERAGLYSGLIHAASDFDETIILSKFKTPTFCPIFPSIIDRSINQNVVIHEHDCRFLTCRFLFDVSDFFLESLLFVHLFSNCKSVNLKDGSKVSLNIISKMIEELTVNTWISFGLSASCSVEFTGNPFPNLIEVGFICKHELFSQSLDLIVSILTASVIEAHHVQSTIKQVINDLSESKRDGNFLIANIQDEFCFKNSVLNFMSIFNLLPLLKSFKKKNIPSLVTRINSLLNHFKSCCDEGNYRILVSTKDQSNLIDSLTLKFPQLSSTLDVSFQSNFQSFSPHPVHVYNSPVLTCCFVRIVIKGPDVFDFPHKAATLVALEYLNAPEGPLYSIIRGKGLAYNFNLSCDTETGLFTFELTECSDPVSAHQSFIKIMRELLSDTARLDSFLFKAAVSSTLYSLAACQSTSTSLSFSSFMLKLKGSSLNYFSTVADAVASVSEVDVLAAMRMYLEPFLSFESSRTFFICPDSVVSGLSNYLDSCSVDFIHSSVSKLYKTSLPFE
ncbi:hypothetical protein RCL1_002891 [Eukaryota sp. TZLM3-RCL]